MHTNILYNSASKAITGKLFLLALCCFATSTPLSYAQIDKEGYHLVYSSETPEAALADMPSLSEEELAVCSGDFVSRENLERNWVYSPRQTSTWNKRMAENEDDRALVHLAEDGMLRLLAISTNGSADGFVTSGIEMKQGYKYGIFEVKAKCNPHVSNFPAVWMMPEDQQAGWPNCGEIDIMEQIGTSSTVHSTVHLGARYSQSVGRSYDWTGNRWFDEGYHIYSLRWDNFSLTFYTDGIQVFRYVKDLTLDYEAHSEYEEAQFPYNKAFYLMLDQALGMDQSWGAQDPDPDFTYEMDVAYVRIFQSSSCENELSYYLIRNVAEPDYYMAITTDDKLVGTTQVDAEQPDSGMVFRFIPTVDEEKVIIQSISGKALGSSMIQNKQIKADSQGSPYYLIYDETKGIAFDYKHNEPDLSFAAGSRALVLNAEKDYIISTSGTSSPSAWWTLEEVNSAMGIQAIAPEKAQIGTCQKIIHDGKIVVVIGNRMYNMAGIRIH